MGSQPALYGREESRTLTGAAMPGPPPLTRVNPAVFSLSPDRGRRRPGSGLLLLGAAGWRRGRCAGWGGCRHVRLVRALEAFEGEGEVGAALGGDEGVDLVDDDGVDGAEGFGGLGGQEEVEGFGSGDQDFGGSFAEALRALFARCRRCGC